MKVDEIVHRKVRCKKKKKGNRSVLLQTEIIFSSRRIRDRQVQDRIREITGQMLRRRNGVRGNALEEKRLAELELREVDLFFLSLIIRK